MNRQQFNQLKRDLAEYIRAHGNLDKFPQESFGGLTTRQGRDLRSWLREVSEQYQNQHQHHKENGGS
jgi:hypothetical protein